MKTYRIYFVIFFAFVSLLIYFRFKDSDRKNTDTVKFWASLAPMDSDPIEYNWMANSQVFASTFATLVTQHKRGEYVGLLAKAWSTQNNKKVWVFDIRDNMYYSNGDPITATSILKSFTRLTYIMSKRGSNEGLLSNIVGYENIKSPTEKIEGLISEGNTFKMVFTKPMPKVLDLISFGLYSIVHKDDFDEKDGKWKDPKKFISSGPYSLVSWTKTDLLLRLRDNYIPSLGHKNKFKNIYVSWDKTQNRHDFDIFWGPEYEEPNNDLFVFSNGARNYIMYFKCYSWKNKNSPLFSLDVRRKLQSAFYSLVNKEFSLTSSFFPLAISGITPPQKEFNSVPLNNILKTPLKVNYPRAGSDFFKKIYTSTWQRISEANRGLVEEVHIDPPLTRDLDDPDRKEFHADIGVHYTDIFLESPDEDIRFMFLSKESIQLPDTSGEITPLLRQNSFDFQIINELIWKQAAIWPIMHFSIGIWSKPKVDVSKLNFLKAHIDFFWVGSI